MATWEDIQKANSKMQSIDIKGKPYMEVNQRIKAFRVVYPEGFILSEMLSNENGVCVFKTTVGFYRDDGEATILGIGHAYEKEGSTFINKTSYIENAETSSTGRALSMCGFGIDTSVASYEEVSNAILNQGEKVDMSVIKGDALAKRCKAEGIEPSKVAELYKVQDLYSLTDKQFSHINMNWAEVKRRCAE